MSTIQELLQEHGIEKPLEWLATQRKGEICEGGIWYQDLFKLAETKDLLKIEWVIECGVRLRNARSISFQHDRAFVELCLTQPTTKVFELCEDNSYIVVRMIETELYPFYLSFGDIMTCDGPDIGLALAHSWDRSRDREKAYQARSYLCYAVECLMREALAQVGDYLELLDNPTAAWNLPGMTKLVSVDNDILGLRYIEDGDGEAQLHTGFGNKDIRWHGKELPKT